MKTKKEKIAFNEAILKAYRLVRRYDGIIPDDFERNFLANEIKTMLKKIKK